MARRAISLLRSNDVALGAKADINFDASRRRFMGT
jgi:hypothetical protein